MLRMELHGSKQSFVCCFATKGPSVRVEKFPRISRMTQIFYFLLRIYEPFGVPAPAGIGTDLQRIAAAIGHPARVESLTTENTDEHGKPRNHSVLMAIRRV